MSRIILLDGGMGQEKPAVTFMNNGLDIAGTVHG